MHGHEYCYKNRHVFSMVQYLVCYSMHSCLQQVQNTLYSKFRTPCTALMWVCCLLPLLVAWIKQRRQNPQQPHHQYSSQPFEGSITHLSFSTNSLPKIHLNCVLPSSCSWKLHSISSPSHEYVQPLRFNCPKNLQCPSAWHFIIKFTAAV